ncbi:MAG: type III-A CRISPR-associated protein Csm2 [Bacteroidota bacterium]
MPYLPKPDLADLTAEEIDAKANELNDKQKQVKFAADVKTSQLRNVFSHITSLRSDFRQAKQEGKLAGSDLPPGIERRLILLKPKIAYAKGRKPKELKNFQELMFEAIDGVVNSKNKVLALENFFALMEAIVAYHKFHGGKE